MQFNSLKEHKKHVERRVSIFACLKKRQEDQFKKPSSGALIAGDMLCVRVLLMQRLLLRETKRDKVVNNW